MNRYDVSEPPGQLLLTVRPESQLPNLIGLPILCGLLLVVVGVMTAFIVKYMPSAWPIPAILVCVLLIYLAIVGKDYFQARSLSASGEVYRFDRTHNVVTHNGVLLAVLDQIESIKMAVVDPLRTASHSLSLVLRDGSEVRIPNVGKSEIESLAPTIGSYLGVRVINDF